MFSLDLKGTGNLPCVRGEGDVAVVMVIGEEEVYPTPGFIGNVQFMLHFFFCQAHIKDSRIPPINF